MIEFRPKARAPGFPAEFSHPNRIWKVFHHSPKQSMMSCLYTKQFLIDVCSFRLCFLLGTSILELALNSKWPFKDLGVRSLNLPYCKLRSDFPLNRQSFPQGIEPAYHRLNTQHIGFYWRTWTTSGLVHSQLWRSVLKGKFTCTVPSMHPVMRCWVSSSISMVLTAALVAKEPILSPVYDSHMLTLLSAEALKNRSPS